MLKYKYLPSSSSATATSDTDITSLPDLLPDIKYYITVMEEKINTQSLTIGKLLDDRDDLKRHIARLERALITANKMIKERDTKNV